MCLYCLLHLPSPSNHVGDITQRMELIGKLVEPKICHLTSLEQCVNHAIVGLCWTYLLFRELGSVEAFAAHLGQTTGGTGNNYQFVNAHSVSNISIHYLQVMESIKQRWVHSIVVMEMTI